jgi:glycosyltransferase involved in cell wall biosynthesis
LQEQGHDVEVISLELRQVREHEVLEPTVIGYSNLKRTSDRLRQFLDIDEESKIPNIRRLYQEMASFDPDVVIIRNYKTYSLISMVLARLTGAEIMIHDQWPVCRPTVSQKKQIVNTAYKQLFDVPLVRVSPVKGDCKLYDPIPDEYYLPFVYDPEFVRPYEEKEYLSGDRINIIMIAKLWQKRKRHPDLLDGVDQLSHKYDIKLTIVGSLQEHKSASWLQGHIDSRDMNHQVEVLQNLSYTALQDIYFEHDLFVLPSENEPAAVSLLEAMTHGLPVISSDDNGTQWYVDEGENGYVFETGKVADLRDKIESIIKDMETISRMGKRSYELAVSRHNPDRYSEQLVQIVKDEFR